jgi:eukaryotic-like serine/threonine-protein kinase
MSEIVPGSLLGPYRIEGVLGAGGMGRVYKALDTRLDRAVAIKTSDARFTERFAREARAISALNHPNICTLYDVGPDYLVMELIEGQSLADRLLHGPIPVGAALEIAAQIAAALDVAHGKGIIHRDLKPANIEITSSGTVKVLDFGLARIESPDTLSVAPAGLTQVGAVLGTSGYMAPEQLRGEPVDKRADIWAFGVVLYEMITGKRPPGSASGDALEVVLASGAGWERIPANVRHLLKCCLAEDPRDRLRDIGDFRLVLEQAPAAASPSYTSSRRAFAGTVAGAIGATALGAWGWLRAPGTREPDRVRFTATLPAGARMTRASVCAPSLALLPDGRTLIIAATDNTGRRLYRRGIDELTATPIAGTSEAMSPFCSPDGRWIGFYADGKLRYVPVEGGAPLDIAPAPGAPTGASWGPDDRIVFTYGWRSPLYVAPVRGGHAEVIAPLRAEERDTYMRRPEFLPGGRQVLVELRRERQEGSPIVAVAIDLESGRRVVLAPGGTPRYSSGQLLIAGGPALLAAPFDLKSLTLTGSPALIVEGVAVEAGGPTHYAVSPSGSLAHAPGAERYALAVSDLSGSQERVLDERGRLSRPRFAPGGRRVAVAVRPDGSGGDDVWLYDTAAPGTGARLTFDGGTAPIWSPDGTAVAFSGDPFWTLRRASGLYIKNADGRAEEQRLVEMNEFHRPIAWTSEQVLLELTTAEGEFWIEVVRGGERQRLARGANARLSPDGKLLAYVSDESGRDTVYVTALGEGAARWQIAEASDPVWAPDGSQLYYVSGTRLVAAQLDVSAGVRVVVQRTVQDSFAVPAYGDYDVSPDGRSIALIRPFDLARGREVVLAINRLA